MEESGGFKGKERVFVAENGGWVLTSVEKIKGKRWDDGGGNEVDFQETGYLARICLISRFR